MDCHWIAIPPISSDILLKIVSSKMILMIIIMVMMVIILILIMMTMIIAFIQSLFSQPPTAAGGNHHLSGFCQNITTIVIITINKINFFLILNVVMILNNTKILFSRATATKTAAISTEGYLYFHWCARSKVFSWQDFSMHLFPPLRRGIKAEDRPRLDLFRITQRHRSGRKWSQTHPPVGRSGICNCISVCIWDTSWGKWSYHGHREGLRH